MNNQWALTGPDPPLLYDPGEDTVVCYNPASGDTYRLSRPAATLLSQLSQHPASLDSLEQQLAASAGAAGSEGQSVDVSALLEEMEALGLIRRAH
ncbi:HPr-rel-A system PqqD family peptide chaperone [Pseudohaliea sp.]|uniref:HPr-rel-A system PqqD family peptide chaperone n=1 Tax=Pseudohaliea sp. TaxID=2740289 RepID=UPI0032EB0957